MNIKVLRNAMLYNVTSKNGIRYEFDSVGCVAALSDTWFAVHEVDARFSVTRGAVSNRRYNTPRHHRHR